MTCSTRYQPIFNRLKFMLYCARVLNNVVITTVIEMVEMVEILDGRVGKCSVERVKCNKQFITLGHCENEVISLVLCISTRLRLVTILTLLMKYIIIFHVDLCNKSYIIYIYIYNIWTQPRSLYPRSHCACRVIKYIIHSCRYICSTCIISYD